MADIKLNQVCYATLGMDQSWSLENYLKVGGYEALKKVIKDGMTPEAVIDPYLVWRTNDDG